MYRKGLLVLWFLNILSPLLLFLIPAPQMTCFVCQANHHILCELEGHDCSHANATLQPHPCQAPQSKTSHASVGHKCPQGRISFNSIAEVVRLASSNNILFYKSHVEKVPIPAGTRVPPSITKLIEHPPQISPA